MSYRLTANVAFVMRISIKHACQQACLVGWTSDRVRMRSNLISYVKQTAGKDSTEAPLRGDAVYQRNLIDNYRKAVYMDTHF